MKKDKKHTSILRFYPFTKGLRHNFVLALVSIVIAVFANYMTPQVIRVTVDSVINDSPFNLPAFLTGWIESLGGRAFLRENIVLCALASCVFMGRLGVGQPSPGAGYGFDAITGVVIGGASLDGGSGGAVGTLVGILVVGVLNNIMNLKGVSSYYQLLAKGIMILVAVIVDMKTKESIAKSGMKK